MAEDEHSVTIKINGEILQCNITSRMLLSDFIRQEIKLTGTHVGCEHGVCGACTVLVNGKPMRSCLMFAVQCNDQEIETVESLVSEDGTLHALQEAFRQFHALQCGFCTPGILMTMKAFLAQNPLPDEAEVREALSGNLCRCTGYQHIVEAVLSVVNSNDSVGSENSR